MMEKWSGFIDRLDEVMGAGMLTSIAIVAMGIGYNHSVTQMCVTGVVALLAAKIAKDGGGKI